MGKSASKEQKQKKHDSSASYINADEGVTEDVQTLHSEPIHSLCAVDQGHLLSGGADKDLILYSWPRHIAKARFSGPTRDVTKVDYSPTPALIHAACRDRMIYEWKWPPEDTTDRPGMEIFQQPDQTLHGHTLGVTALASCEAYEHLLCSGSRDNSVCLWDTVTGKPVSSMYIPRNLVTGLEWVGEEKAVLQSSEDKMLRVWDLRSCSVAQLFRAKQHVQTCCAVSEDTTFFVSGSSGSGSHGGELTLWDRRNEKKFVREFRGHTESVQGCMFLSVEDGIKDTYIIVSAGSDSTVRLWERETGQSLHSEYISGAGPITSLVSPSQGLVACSSFKGGVCIWTVSLGLDSSTSNPWTLSIRAKYL